MEDDQQSNDAFTALTDELERLIVYRGYVTPLSFISCICSSAAWFFIVQSVAAFMSALTIVFCIWLIYSRIRINKIAENLQVEFEKLKDELKK